MGLFIIFIGECFQMSAQIDGDRLNSRTDKILGGQVVRCLVWVERFEESK